MIANLSNPSMRIVQRTCIRHYKRRCSKVFQVILKAEEQQRCKRKFKSCVGYLFTAKTPRQDFLPSGSRAAFCLLVDLCKQFKTNFSAIRNDHEPNDLVESAAHALSRRMQRLLRRQSDCKEPLHNDDGHRTWLFQRAELLKRATRSHLRPNENSFVSDNERRSTMISKIGFGNVLQPTRERIQSVFRFTRVSAEIKSKFKLEKQFFGWKFSEIALKSLHYGNP